MKKKDGAYKSIGEVAKMVGLVDKKKGTLSTHTLRFWEKNFKQIKPKIFSGRRRYYDDKSIEIIKFVKYMLKEKGMTIKGVKTVLNNPSALSLDDPSTFSVINHPFNREKFKEKLAKISKLIKEIKQIKNG